MQTRRWPNQHSAGPSESRRYLDLLCHTENERKTSTRAQAVKRRMEFNLISSEPCTFPLGLKTLGKGPIPFCLCQLACWQKVAYYSRIGVMVCKTMGKGRVMSPVVKVQQHPQTPDSTSIFFQICAGHFLLRCYRLFSVLYILPYRVLCQSSGLSFSAQAGLNSHIQKYQPHVWKMDMKKAATNWPVNLALTGTVSLSSGFVCCFLSVKPHSEENFFLCVRMETSQPLLFPSLTT